MSVRRTLAVVMCPIALGLVAGCAASPPPIEEFDAAQLAVVDTYVRSSVPEAR